MGKLLQNPITLHQFARFITSKSTPRRSVQVQPVPRARPSPSPETGGSRHKDIEHQVKISLAKAKMEAENSQQRQLPLAEVVEDCVKRWFQDTLKQAKAGDTAMQVLVGQMYCSGYGVPRDEQKGKAWINRASRSRSSGWKVADKHPGYNASDSDSDAKREDAK